MAALDGIITFSTAEYRPCYVDGEKAVFHKWVEYSDIIPPSPMVGGHVGGARKYTLAIVEFESGRIAEVPPTTIKFADNKIKEFAFAE